MMMTIRYQWMSLTACMRVFSSLFPEFCPTFEWCQTDHCWQDVVWWLVDHSCLGRPSDVVVASMVKLSKIRRDVCRRSTLQAWCCKCHWHFSGDAPQCTPYSSYISIQPQPNSDELCGGVKTSNYYTLVTKWLSPVQNQLVSSSFMLIGRFGWRHRLIWSLIAWPYMQISIHLSMCIRCRSLIAWITNYYIILI